MHIYVYTIKLGTVKNHGNTEITEAVIFVKCRVFAKMPCLAVFLPKSFNSTVFFYVFYNNFSFLININGVIVTQKYLFYYCCKRPYALLLTGSICDHDVVVNICILMLRSDKILQMQTLHYM